MQPTQLHDFGGSGPTLHLAHANGFPPGTYRPLVERLIGEYHVISLPLRALWAGSQPDSAPDWHILADDLLRGLDERGLRGIVGVGHSIGGVLTLYNAVRRPDLFRAIVLVDPVMLPPSWLWLVRLIRLLRLQRQMPLVRGALRRRRTWPSRQESYQYLRGKSFFAAWPDNSLWAYIEAGTRLRTDGEVELVYPPEWEAHIFATTPTDVWQIAPRLHTATLVIRGGRSNTFPARSQAHMARLAPHVRFAVVPDAGHMLPLERPAQTATAILEFLQRSEAQDPDRNPAEL